jgi:hypothetical protein
MARSLLLPKEHGAYFQLALPLVTALAMGRPTVAAALLTVASVAGFLAHESLLVLLGRRGARATREESALARRTLVGIGLVGAIAGVLGVLLAPSEVRMLLLLPLAAIVPVGAAIFWNRERTAAGELAAAVALAALAVPVACASGVSRTAALEALASWVVTFSAGTLAVRAMIAFQKAKTTLFFRVLPLALPFAGAAMLSRASLWDALAPAPVLLVALVVALTPPHPRALRRIGWGLAAATLGTVLFLVLGAHVG